MTVAIVIGVLLRGMLQGRVNLARVGLLEVNTSSAGVEMHSIRYSKDNQNAREHRGIY